MKELAFLLGSAGVGIALIVYGLMPRFMSRAVNPPPKPEPEPEPTEDDARRAMFDAYVEREREMTKVALRMADREECRKAAKRYGVDSLDADWNQATVIPTSKTKH